MEVFPSVMAVLWLVLSCLLIGGACGAPSHVTPVSQASDCTGEEFIQTGGVCDSVEHREIQEICRQIRVEQARVYNRMETGYEAADGVSCFGDILMDKRQALELLRSLVEERRSRGADEGGKRLKRKVLSYFESNKWPTHIYYRMDPSVQGIVLSNIRAGISMLEWATCFQFTETQDADFNTQHLVFVDDKRGCRSYIGRTSYLKQPIYLTSWCGKATVAHEIAHALGFIHEHQRPDRDAYITIHEHNIVPGVEGNFERYIHGKTLGVQYDYSSVMQYGGKAAVPYMNGGESIEAVDGRYQKTMGQRVELSYLDAQTINQQYCSEICEDASPLSCHHHGYQDPHDCSKCRCPDGWEGTLCDAVAKGKKADCGGTLVASSEPQYIESPGYNAGVYQSGQECTWLIKTHPGSHVKLEFMSDFGLYSHMDACFHWVEVRLDTDKQVVGPRFCGYSLPLAPLKSAHSEAMVMFRARFNLNMSSGMRGFLLKYSSDDTSCADNPDDPACHMYQYDGDRDLDLVLMVDRDAASESDFHRKKTLAVRLLQSITSPHLSLHHGILSFTGFAFLEAELAHYQDQQVLIEIVTSLRRSSSITNYFDPLEMLYERFYTGAGGDRPAVSNVAIMLVDSQHRFSKPSVIVQDVQTGLRKACIQVVVVAIGDKPDLSLLVDLVGKPNIVYTESHEGLQEVSFVEEVMARVKTAAERSDTCLHGNTESSTEKTMTTTESTTVPTTTSTTESTTVPTTTTSTTTESTTVPTTTSTTESTTVPTTTSTTESTTVPTTTSTTESTTVPTTTSTTESTTVPTTTSTTESTTVPTTTSTTESTTVPTTTSTTESTTVPTTTSTTTERTTVPSAPPSTTTSTTQPTPAPTTPGVVGSGCSSIRGVCDRNCGGCGRRDVMNFCYVNGIMVVKEKYREACNTLPCEVDCSLWHGFFYYRRTCLRCCPDYSNVDGQCVKHWAA